MLERNPRGGWDRLSTFHPLTLLKMDGKFRTLVEDSQDLGLTAGALGLWEDSTAAATL